MCKYLDPIMAMPEFSQLKQYQVFLMKVRRPVLLLFAPEYLIKGFGRSEDGFPGRLLVARQTWNWFA